MEQEKNIHVPGLDIQGAYQAYEHANTEAITEWASFMTPQHLAALQSFSKDGGLHCRLAHPDENIPIAAIYLETNGHIVIHPAIFLACIRNTHGCNRAVLNFIIGHEIGHFLDMYSINDKPTYFAIELEILDRFFERQAKREKDMWEWYCNVHNIKDPQAIVEQLGIEDDRSPFNILYHELFNKLDDTVVNEYGLHHSRIQEKPGTNQATCNRDDLSTIYRHSLFPEPKNPPPDFESFGNYILSQTMDKKRVQPVSNAVQTALDTPVQIDGQPYTILTAHQHFTTYYTRWYGAKRYLEYERWYLNVFESLLRDYLQSTPPIEVQQYLQNRPRTDTSSHEDTKDVRKKVKGQAKERSKYSHAAKKVRNKNAGTSDKVRIHQEIQAAAGRFADAHNLNANASRDYHTALYEIGPSVEKYAQQLAEVIRRKMDKKTITQTIRTDDGSLHTPTVTNHASTIISGQLDSAPPLYRQRTMEEILVPVPIQLSIDLALDNSGSTQPFIQLIQKNCVLLEHVCMRTQEMLEADGCTDVMLDVHLHLFGNTSRTIKEPQPNTEKNTVELIRAFAEITCNEGTNLADLAAVLAKKPAKAEVHTILIGITDGYIADESAAKTAFEALPAIAQTWLIIATDQAIDVSLEDYTAAERERLHSSGPYFKQEAEAAFAAKVAQWHELNNEVLASNPMQDWQHAVATNGADIIAHVMNSVITQVERTSL